MEDKIKETEQTEEILDKDTSLEETVEETVTEDNDSAEVLEEETELSKAKKELEAQKDKYLRLMAEYDNFRKRSAKERIELTGLVKGDTVSEILPIIDNFERALATETADDNYKQGVTMIFNQFNEVLKKLGVEVIDPVGKEFDPNESNAVNQVEDENYGENIVCSCFQKGYKIGDKVIRYAMVVVANP